MPWYKRCHKAPPTLVNELHISETDDFMRSTCTYSSLRSLPPWQRQVVYVDTEDDNRCMSIRMYDIHAAINLDRGLGGRGGVCEFVSVIM